jgi:hypothetical protein
MTANSDGESTAQKALIDEHASDYIAEYDMLGEDLDGQAPHAGIRWSSRIRFPPVRYPENPVNYLAPEGKDQEERTDNKAGTTLSTALAQVSEKADGGRSGSVPPSSARCARCAQYDG